MCTTMYKDDSYRIISRIYDVTGNSMPRTLVSMVCNSWSKNYIYLLPDFKIRSFCEVWKWIRHNPECVLHYMTS